ncbi:hypothetical protein MKW92_020278 [Papaver armeniacum]|nr:hypothetical protein MKW92_020278 [Papaver armeniacum]
MIQPRGRLTNRNKETAQHIFRKEHKGLLKEGENWMKSTAAVWMKVASLVTAITLLSVVISALGGANNGIHKNPFVIFAVALALISSFTSVIMFYSIILSYYAEEEFLTSLPLKLVLGHATLCFSLAMMLVTYTAQLNIVMGNDVYGVQLFAAILVLLVLVLAVGFTFSQIKLLIQMFRFTYRRTG